MSNHPDQRSHPRRILLVEDEMLVAMATRHSLESAGYRVELARNGEDAVRIAVQSPSVNLVLMDIDLGPGIDGTEAAQRILDAREIPIVFLSSHTEKELVDKVRGITRYGYVIKDSGDFVLNASLEMAFELFDANRREQEQAARFGAIVQAQPDRMFVVGVDGTFREAYTPHDASLAIPEDHIAGTRLRDVFGEQEAERHMAAYRTCVETGELQSFEYEMTSRSHARRFEARISKLDDETVLAIVREITESRRMEDELNRLVALYRMIVDVSTSCINLSRAEIPEAIRSALGSMARAIGADRAYVFDYDFERQIAVNRFEWCSPGTEPQMDRLQSLPLAEIEAGITRHRDGMPHHVPVVAALPEGALRDVLEPQGVQSMLAVPLLSGGACIGSVGFDFVAEPHSFSPEETALLTVFAELLVNLREREAAEERLRVLFDGARDNILIHEMGPDGLPGNYIDVNESTCETLGYTREELLTMSPLDTTAPGDLESVPQRIATLKEGDSLLVEARGKRKDGHLVPFELNIHRITVGGRDTIIAVSRDITDRRMAEELQRKMTEMAPVALYVYDLGKGCLVFANAEYERQLGYTFDDLQKMGDRMPSIIYHPEEHERLRNSRFELYENQDDRPRSHDYKLLRKDGSTAWAVIRESVITRKPDGSPEKVIGIGIDITRRKEAEATIEALLREKELLLTEVHHRVKNNMLSVSSLLSLQAGATESAEAAAALTEARSRMQSMAVLYDRLYRSENLREMPLGEYLAPLVREILATHSRAESVSLEIETCDAMLPVSLLAGIGMIVNEAISNTVKHAFPVGAVGRIAVSATRANDRLEITIADDGVGIPDEIDLGKSNGFGLQLIQSLASQHGLQIRIERGSGTRLVIGIDGGY